MSKVVVPLDSRVGVHDEGAEQLHPDDGVDKEEDAHQHAHIWQGLNSVVIFICHSENAAHKKCYP